MKHLFLSLLTFCLFTGVKAQVPVSKEPMHQDIFDNDHIRLLDVHIQPGDTTQFHIHATPSVFLILTDVKTGSQVIQQEDPSVTPVIHYGNMYFEGFYKKPRIHRVWNSDTTAFHVMDIELPNKNYVVINPPISNTAFTYLFDEKPVRAYRVNLDPRKGVAISPRKADVLIIRLTDLVSTIKADNKTLMKKGAFLYVSSGHSIHIKNEGPSKTSFAFFEIK